MKEIKQAKKVAITYQGVLLLLTNKKKEIKQAR
jgi:hypothetical protein